MKPPLASKFKLLFQSIALGMLFGAILQLTAPEATIITKKTLALVQSGAVWNPYKSSVFFTLLASLVALLALLPRCCRETTADKIFSAIVGVAAVMLTIYSVFCFL